MFAVLDLTPPRSLVVFNRRCQRVWEREHPGEGPRPYWKWEPSNCKLDELDAAKFCRVMEGRRGILFAGASLYRTIRQRFLVLRSRFPGDV